MIKTCWKCQRKFDTREVDPSATVGLCQRCFDRFDDAQAPQAVAEPEPRNFFLNEQHQMPSGATVNGVDMSQGRDTTVAQTVGFPPDMVPGESVLIIITEVEVSPYQQTAEDMEYIRQRVLQTLLSGARERPEPPRVSSPPNPDHLRAELSLLVQKMRDDFTRNGNMQEAKQELRTRTVQLLRKASPFLAQEEAERLVDAALEEAFKDVSDAPPPPMLMEAGTV